MAEIKEIGRVISKFSNKADPFIMKKEESSIEILPEYAEGLFDIESNKYLQILFHFNKSDSYKLKVRWYYGDEKGVFACRSPNRPGAIGLTTVELIERRGDILRVRGLDAIDGTPVLDIKPLIPHTDLTDAEKSVSQDFRLKNPRGKFIPLIINKDLKALFLEAGSLHGHYCPGLALGTIASVYGIHKLSKLLNVPIGEVLSSKGMEELISVVEINSCFIDGVQFTSGCTIGNNSLIYRDIGKTAVTFYRSDGHGIRVLLKPDYKKYFNTLDSRFETLFEQVVVQRMRDSKLLKDFLESSRELSMKILDIPFDNLFYTAEVVTTIPPYSSNKKTVNDSPIKLSVCSGFINCAKCGEPVMDDKLIKEDGKEICRACSKEYSFIDATGIMWSKK